MFNLLGDLNFPKVVLETSTKLNGKVRIVEVGKSRKLIVENTIASVNPDSPLCDKLYWGQTVNIIKEQAPTSKRMLILGLGGGTLPWLLSRSFPEAEFVSVEIDPEIIELGKKYFDIDKIPRHKIIQADALRVVVEPEEFDLAPSSFDILIVDIFQGDVYPDLGETGNFMGAIKRLVCSGGLIIFNRIYTQKHQEDTNEFVKQVQNFLKDVNSEIVAGYTNSDNLLIYGRT